MYSIIQCNKEYVMRGRAGGIQREPGDTGEQPGRSVFNEWSSETSKMSRKSYREATPRTLTIDHCTTTCFIRSLSACLQSQQGTSSTSGHSALSISLNE